jgi:hypothetical protein
MSDLIDQIYEVFEEISKAKQAQDFILLQEKEEQLEKLREELADRSKNQRARIQTLEKSRV